jgi:hypothetical protein
MAVKEHPKDDQNGQIPFFRKDSAEKFPLENDMSYEVPSHLLWGGSLSNVDSQVLKHNHHFFPFHYIFTAFKSSS